MDLEGLARGGGTGGSGLGSKVVRASLSEFIEAEWALERGFEGGRTGILGPITPLPLASEVLLFLRVSTSSVNSDTSATFFLSPPAPAPPAIKRFSTVSSVEPSMSLSTS